MAEPDLAATIAFQEALLANQAKTIFEHRETIARQRQKLEYADVVAGAQQEEIERLRAEVAVEHEQGRKQRENYETLLSAAYDERDTARAEAAQQQSNVEQATRHLGEFAQEAERLQAAVHELEEQVTDEQGRTQGASHEAVTLALALRDIANVLGTGACTVPDCPGCHYEMQEAADLARKAVGLKPVEFALKTEAEEAWSAGFEAGRGYPNAVVIPDNGACPSADHDGHCDCHERRTQ